MWRGVMTLVCLNLYAPNLPTSVTFTTIRASIRCSGTAERLVRPEVVRRGCGVPLQLWTSVVGRRGRFEESVKRSDVAGRRSGKRLLDEVVARDVDGIHPIH